MNEIPSLISVIVPCYNQGKYLTECLHSVLIQTYKRWECIIINDGSSDNTEEISHMFCQSDERFYLINIKNGGLANARNIGIKKAKGKYILPLDADDKIGPDYLSEACDTLDQNSKIKVVYANARYFGKKDGAWKLAPYSLFELMFENMIFCSALFRKIDFEEYGGYKLDMKHGFEDWDLWVGILKNGGGVVKLEKTHFFYRVTEGSMVNAMTQQHYEDMQKKIWSRHADVWVKRHKELMALKNKLNEMEQKPFTFLLKKLSAKLKMK